MMRFDFSYFQLLAGGSRLESMGKQFRKGSKTFDSGDLVLWLIAVAAIILVFWLLVRYKEQQDGPDRTNSPRRLFRELRQAQRLTLADRWLLWRIARWQRLSQPAKLFLEPERYEPANLSPRLRSRTKQLAKLRDKLFSADH